MDGSLTVAASLCEALAESSSGTDHHPALVWDDARDAVDLDRHIVALLFARKLNGRRPLAARWNRQGRLLAAAASEETTGSAGHVAGSAWLAILSREDVGEGSAKVRFL